MLTLEQFKAARSVLRGVIRDTSLIHSAALSKSTGHNVYLKPENMQVTGAYKIRGAYYKISTLSQEEKERGLITASAATTPRVWPTPPRPPECPPPSSCPPPPPW